MLVRRGRTHRREGAERAAVAQRAAARRLHRGLPGRRRSLEQDPRARRHCARGSRLAHKGFHRKIGIFAQSHVTPEGELVTEAEWKKRESSWLPSDERPRVRAARSWVASPSRASTRAGSRRPRAASTSAPETSSTSASPDVPADARSASTSSIPTSASAATRARRRASRRRSRTTSGTTSSTSRKCNACGDCLPPCPTGAIDTWREVRAPFTVEAQLGWDSLPAPERRRAGRGGRDDAAAAPAPTSMPDEVSRLVDEATARRAGASRRRGRRRIRTWGSTRRERPAVATVAGTYRLTDEDADVDIRHIVLDFGRTAFPVLEGQTHRHRPARHAMPNGRPHHVRLYSVASPRNGERPKHNNLALTVKRVTSDHDGTPGARASRRTTSATSRAARAST